MHEAPHASRSRQLFEDNQGNMLFLNGSRMPRMSGCVSVFVMMAVSACGGGNSLTSADSNPSLSAAGPAGLETALAAASEFGGEGTRATLLPSEPRAPMAQATDAAAADSTQMSADRVADGATAIESPVPAQAASPTLVAAHDMELALSTTQAATPPSAKSAPPAPTDMSGMDMSAGPAIDKSKIRPRATGYANERIRSVWRNIHTGSDCLQGSPACSVAPSNVPSGPFPNDIGAFRVVCGFASMSYDDPIVFPGQPGKSHLHTFFGNTNIDSSTTTESILTGNSTCAGGILNRSGYWVPTMIDTTDGTPLVPTLNNVYYKCSYALPLGQACDQMQALPTGLRMIAGNARNTNPKTVGAHYICYGPHGENPGWKSTITDAFKDGTCVPGGDFVMEISFPNCWDGVNLDSPNHSSHIVHSEQFQRASGQWDRRCPADHPVVLPAISYNIHYKPVHVDKWRLSSDMYDPSLPAGLSGHGDYFMGWDKKTMETFITHCDRAHRDCHDFLLGYGTTLF